MPTDHSLKDTKVLIVGGAGFVGSNLCHHLLAQHDSKEILLVDNLLPSDMANVPMDPRVRFIFGSIARRQNFASTTP